MSASLSGLCGDSELIERGLKTTGENTLAVTGSIAGTRSAANESAFGVGRLCSLLSVILCAGRASGGGGGGGGVLCGCGE